MENKYLIRYNGKFWAKGGGYTAFWDKASVVELEEIKKTTVVVKFDNGSKRELAGGNNLIALDVAKATFKNSETMNDLEEYKIYDMYSYKKTFGHMSGYEWSWDPNWYVVADLYMATGYETKKEAEVALEKIKEKYG